MSTDGLAVQCCILYEYQLVLDLYSYVFTDLLLPLFRLQSVYCSENSVQLLRIVWYPCTPEIR